MSRCPVLMIQWRLRHCAGKHRPRSKCGERWGRKHPHPLPLMCSLLRNEQELRRLSDRICIEFLALHRRSSSLGRPSVQHKPWQASFEVAGIGLQANGSPTPVQHVHYLSGHAPAARPVCCAPDSHVQFQYASALTPSTSQ